MSGIVRGLLISAWVLAIGLCAVYLEVEHVRSGVVIRQLMLERDARIERFRRLEMRFNEKASPDRLERQLPEELKVAATGRGASP